MQTSLSFFNISINAHNNSVSIWFFLIYFSQAYNVIWVELPHSPILVPANNPKGVHRVHALERYFR